MKKIGWKQLTLRRMLGVATMAAGVAILLMPIVTGVWVTALIGVFLVGAGLLQFVEAVRTPGEDDTNYTYISGVVTTLLGLLLFLSPHIAFSALLIGVCIFIFADGAIRVYGAFKQSGHERRWGLFNGLFSIILSLFIFFIVSAQLGVLAVGILLGIKLLVEGWTMFFLPQRGFDVGLYEPDTSVHPDAKLDLAPNELVRGMQDEILQSKRTLRGQYLQWSVYFLLIFFAIHVLRTDAQWSWIGLISPFAAVVGDAAVALLLSVIVILPARLIWRKLTRPLERVAWRRFYYLHEKSARPTIGERLLRFWLEARMRFAIELAEVRYSLNFAFWKLLSAGLPLTAVLIAVNTIWGFSWYFNSENWASAVYQEITKDRVDTWRKRLAEDVEADALKQGVPADQIFAVDPGNIGESEDFSFIVIGDTGEGDPSQMALRDQLIAAGARDDVKFLILSSDVIYPDGRMTDYEANFYLPFKGFHKPIFAIPGNHDWFDANEGFNANFLRPEAALIGMRARIAADLQSDIAVLEQRFRELTAEARDLRTYYGINNGHQRAPFFEMHKPGFSLIAVDTGILRRLDEKESQWFEGALQRAGNNFKMVIIGHPFYVAGRYQPAGDADFDSIYQTARRYGVDMVMGGDTHDFEYYRETALPDGGRPVMHHFVNGGGGAYLSIGTALGFPETPDVADYAFYPRTDELTKKIRNEAPFWKTPVIYWMDWFDGYPFDDEVFSGIFDFNSAPYFQSFVEVAVERSQNRVRIMLYGVNGRLRWRDIQAAGSVKPANAADDDLVEFVIPLLQPAQ